MKVNRGLGKGLSALFSETEEDYGKSLLFDEEPPKKGQDVKEIEVYSIELLDFSDNKFTFKCHVSKGTYIRSLIRDIGYKLDSYACMTNLRRTKLGKFSINDCKLIDELKINNMLNVSEVLTDYTNIKVHESLKKIY